MPKKPSERLCSLCGKECAESERNVDGTYLHTRCAAAEAALQGWNLPGRLLGSRAPKEDTE